VDELDAPRFFQLARRVFAFEGVMAVRYQRLQEDGEPATHTPARTQQRQAAGDSNVIPLDQFRAQFPGLID
jgi:hypothetical protein